MDWCKNSEGGYVGEGQKAMKGINASNAKTGVLLQIITASQVINFIV